MATDYSQHIELLEKAKEFLWDGADFDEYKQRWMEMFICHAVDKAFKATLNAEYTVLDGLSCIIYARIARCPTYESFINYRWNCNAPGSKHQADYTRQEIQAERLTLINELIGHYKGLQ